MIQESLRTEFKDATVITVAHRLQTIMDSDKIVRSTASLIIMFCLMSVAQMVLDAGEVVELDTPRALLKKDDGFFRGLVEGSADRDDLYSAAGL